ETSVAGLVLGHLVIAIPYVVRTVSAGVAGADRPLEEAGGRLGAPPAQALAEVTLPPNRPGVVSGAGFSVLVSCSDHHHSLFVSGPGTVTLPVHIFSQIVWQPDPTIAAASTLQILLIAVLLAIAQRVFRLRVTA